jgi:molybdopterin converting factor small subunit
VKALLTAEDSKNLMRHLPMLYAVNEDYVSIETALVENDIIAFLPPVAGG